MISHNHNRNCNEIIEAENYVYSIVSDKKNAPCIHNLQFLHCKHVTIDLRWFWRWFLFWGDLVLLERWWWQMYSPEIVVISMVMLHWRCQQLLTYVPDIRLNLFSKQNMPLKESKTSDNSLNLIVGNRHLLLFFYSWAPDFLHPSYCNSSNRA